MKDIVVPAPIYWQSAATTTKKNMFQIVSSQSFKHLRFDFFNMRIPTRFGIVAFLNPTQIGEIHEITIKSWMEATSLQPSIPMVGMKKMLRLPWNEHNSPKMDGITITIPGCYPYFWAVFFLFSPIFQGWNPTFESPSTMFLWLCPLRRNLNPKGQGLDLWGGSRRDSSWWVEMIFVTKLKMNSFKILVWIILKENIAI